MGKHEEWRDFLMSLFPDCFRERIPGGTHFDMCIVDMMQFMAKMKGDSIFRPKELADRMVRAAFDYSNIHDNPENPIIDKAVVLLLDTAKNVPKCKATTQIARDTVSVTSPLKADKCNEPSAAATTIMTEEMYEALIKEMGLEYGELMVHSEMKKVPIMMTPTMVWRSNNLKWQLNSMVATSLLKNVTVPRHKVLIVDDGVVFGDPHAYRRLREKVIDDYQFHGKSEYEKEMLISYIVAHTLNMRYVRHHDGQFKRLPESGIGEADVKFGNYISRYSEGKRNPMRRYLIASQDTDIPFILLAHMKRMIDPESDRLDDDIEIWVDTQTPTDRAKGVNRPYRHVNIKGLYYAIIAFFRQEYPTIVNPIETLLFMVNSLETDFTTRLCDKYMGITRRVVWNVFSEIHHQPMELFKTEKEPALAGYVTFSRTKKERSKTIHYSPKAYHLLGDDAIQVLKTDEEIEGDLGGTRQEYRIVLNNERCGAFFYLLCQQALVDDMVKLKMIGNTTPRFYYADPDILLIHTRDLMLSIAAHKNQQTESHDKSMATLLMGKTFILPKEKSLNTPNKPTKKPVVTIGPAIKFQPTDTQRYYDKEAMSVIAKKPIPDMYSIPTRGQMKARIYRLAWILNYIQNGTVAKHYATSCDSTLPLDKERTLYGWQSRELDICGENQVNLNSSYHIQRLTQVILGEMPIRVYATVECDDL